MMKKFVMKYLFLIPFIICTLAACDLFKIDNYEAPNAILKGGILDEVTGQLVETDIQNGSTLKLKELGWAEGGILTRVVMQNGEYQDKMMFAGRYRVEFSECNFYPFIVDEIVVKKGENNLNFQVTPYIRVMNANIRQDGDQVVATFKLQAGKPEVRLNNIQLFMHTDMYVGDQVTSSPLGGSGFSQTFSPAIEIDESKTYTLTIDLTNETNKTYFKYNTKNYYFRVGAMASVENVGTIRRNYAPYTVMKIELQ